MKKKGFNINLWSFAILVLTAVIMVVFGAKVRETDFYIRKQAEIEENCHRCEQAGVMLEGGSDYLTNEVFHFAATGNRTYMENYWHEADTVRSRDIAIEQLSGLSLTDEEKKLAEGAKRDSDALMERETWAMRLISDSVGMAPEDMPPKVAAVRYTGGEGALSPEQKRAAASQYIFGESYSADKEKINRDIAVFLNLLKERKMLELEAAASRTGSALLEVRWLVLALFLAFFVEAVSFCVFMIRPFYYYTKDLKKMGEGGFVALTPMGAQETRSLAEAFNRIYRGWQEQKQALEEERYRFHVALENTSVIVYEYSPVTDTYIASGSLEKHLHAADNQQQEQLITSFLSDHVMEMMGRTGLEYFRRAIDGAECEPIEIPVSSAQDSSRMIWARITCTPVYDENRRVVRLIGKITNIQSEKEKEFALEDARSRDGLTGLYKREAGIAKVRDYMSKKSPDESCAIMLLDMDNFTQINETEGQAFADAILQDVADILRVKTGPEDIQVRLGGDEFMLFVKGCRKSRATVLGPEIAARICEISGHLNSKLKISASIGMCVTEVVDEYSGLYRCAESTLKYVKENGKGRAACYLDTSNELGMLLTQMYPESHLINKIDRQEGGREELPAFALDLLGKSKNLDDAIFLLFSRVGKSCGLDRVLMIEIDTEYLSFRAVYQWSRLPSDLLSEEPRYITREDLKKLTDSYDADGICEKQIISREAEMKSVLHAAIWNYGQCAGALSFEMKDAHQWAAEERQLLSELTKIVSSFTLKARADAVSQAKTDFLSRMSHEIRTPMNAITGMTIIAKTVPGNPEKTVSCLNKIESANKYLLSLINDVLDMSRIESGKMEIHLAAASVGKLTENLDMLIRPQAEDKGLSFEIKNGFAVKRTVMMDELRLNQVLVNLLGNAVKFTGEGGTVTLEIEPARLTDRETVLRFAVTDTGIGISKEAQGRIFNAFEQAGSDTVSNYGGTGLGLAISSRLVQLMGGSLEVRSEPERGSSFYFTLCLSLAEKEEEQNLSRQSEAPFDPTGKRVLLVEDNELNREIAQEILQMHKFSVELAVNGKEAVERFRQNKPGYYDAILMDIRMPVMGGMEATRKIRTMGKADSRTVPIIAMTANAFDEDMKKSLANGMDGHLSKPFDIKILLRTLDDLITSRAAGRPEK